MTRVLEWWNRWGAVVLAVLFVVVFTWLPVRQYNAFRTPGLDFAENDQAIWNTLRGRFLYSSIHEFSILAQHFSPLMALLAPLFLIWSDARMLLLAQAVGLATAGVFLYKIVRVKHPAVAPWFLLAFYLNPALHEVALVEFRRVTIAVPFLALALYALYVRKRWLMTVGLAFAILCKENIAVVVCMVGVYLLFCEHDWKWGLPLAIVGGVWAVVVTFWAIPAFLPPRDGTLLYPQLNYLGIPGSSYGEVIANWLRDPLVLLRRAFDRDALRALWRVFLPLGFVVPFLAPGWLLMSLPSIAYMLMADSPGMHRLEDWYMASILPVLFASVAVALTRLSDRGVRWMVGGLVGAAIVGYVLFSHAPLGGRYEPSLYEVTARHRIASTVVAAVPQNAIVAAQDPYLPHLSHREHIYLYPWIPIGKENVEYFVLDRHVNPYPMTPSQVNDHIDDVVADPSYVVELEADGIYLLYQGGDPLSSFPVDRVAGDSMRLDRVEVAVQDGQGFFRTVDREPIELKPGQQVRVSLYWEALAAPNAERTVSVRIADASGALVAIYDNLPGRGRKPTSWWQEGWKIRDVYYVTVSPQVQLGPGSLDVLVYDSFSSEIVPFDDGIDILTLCSVDLSS